MKKNFYTIILSLFLLTLCSHVQAQQLRINGDATANSGDSKVYTKASKGVVIYAANWTATGGTITSQNINSVTITWNTNPGVVKYNVTSSSAGTLQASKNVTVTVNAPANPPNPTIVSENCSTALLSKTGTIPSGEMWYWQTAAWNTDETYPATSNYNVTSAGTYYIKSKNLSTGLWSAGSGSLTISGSVGGTIWYQDTDGDGLGDPNVTLTQCSQPSGYVANGDDQCPTSNGLGSGNGCPGGPTLSNENYVYTIAPQKEVTAMSQIIQNADALKNVTYLNGLGLPKLTVGIKQSPNEKDIIQYIEYDAFGRQKKEYLPFASTSNTGLYDANALNNTLSYYQNNYGSDFTGMALLDINAYSEKDFEKSPLGRVTKQAAPGKDWKLGNGHEIEMGYQTNAANEVRFYEVSLTSTYVPTLVGGTSYYSKGDLIKTVTKDENHDGSSTKNHTTEEFKNSMGQVILKRTYADISGVSTAHDTYYVYDVHGNLTYVLPPKAEAQVNIPTSTELNELCYQYQYDTRNRLVEKKIPGKGVEYIVYDKLDRPVLTQDANLRTTQDWLFTKYDARGRVAYTGIFHNGRTRLTMQPLFEDDLPQNMYEDRTTSQSTLSGIVIKYTNKMYPTDVNNISVLTVNYYDDYDFDRAGSDLPGNIIHEFGETLTTRTQGLATGSKVKVLGTSNWITTVNYYDTRGRAVYTYSKNDFLGTTDIAQMDLDFTGKTIETYTSHTNTNDALSTQNTRDEFSYDHAGRLTTQKQFLNGASVGEVIASNTYDELGQLTTKKVGGKTTTQTRLQTVDYNYNVRGWLTNMNQDANNDNDLFNFTLRYNNPTSGTALYNGNIVQTSWNTANTDSSTKTYTYSYDALNRIISGIDNTGNYNLTSVSYDKNGNILNLQRKGHNGTNVIAGFMDDLTYTYESTSNKLRKVLDNGDDNYGFKDGANLPTAEYTYDANGNMVFDANKGITNIVYNHLNLPTQVTIGGQNITYTYDASGVKQRKVVQGVATDYAGNYIYENNVLQFFNQAEGYVKASVSGSSVTYSYVYQYKDHLGNVRLSYADSDGNGVISAQAEIIEESNYYPFGLKHKGYNNVVSANGNSVAQKFKYNGIELEESLGLNLYEMELRLYDPAIARWNGIDPVTHYEFSTYSAFDNNPVVWADPSGADSEKVDERGQLHSEMRRKYIGQDVFSENSDDNIIDKIVSKALQGSAVIYADGKNLSKLTEKQKQKYFETDELTTIGILLYEFATGTGKVERDFIYGKHPFATSYLSGRIVEELLGELTAILEKKGYDFKKLPDTNTETIKLEFSPDISKWNPASWKESAQKHANSNHSQFFIGGATARVKIKDQNLYIMIYNNTSRESLYLHQKVGNYKRKPGKKNKILSTIRQNIFAIWKIPKQ
ncbi:DUF6443 domain-containing protein [Pseudotenacibaculum sp. MALMAid0570]|uniref:DUF6443 domain-containing protein n=1 Tax=Pseudotenacibaculum sp. MALMAid0570 TaxID=3143938 RepID=UPI0032DE9EC8